MPVVHAPSDAALADAAARLGVTLTARGWRLATAESCTGGWIAKALTDVAGSSAWFEGGFVTYSNASKTTLLGVPAKLIDDHGAVSEAVVVAMAEGCRGRTGADLACAVSGIAGPGGGTDAKPVGTVWIGFAGPTGVRAECHALGGDRNAIRRFAVEAALTGLLDDARRA
jgi:nicotinamide-nucleotide amidase